MTEITPPAEPVAAVKPIELPRFDKTRDFGETAGHFEEGDPMHGAKWTQDGFLFRVDGTLIEEALTAKDRIRLEEKIKMEAAVAEARAVFRKAAPHLSEADVAKIVTPDAMNVTTEDELDLVAWAKGEKKYIYGKVQAAFRDRFHQTPVNRQQALEILSEHGLMTFTPQGGPTIPSMS